MKRIWTMAILAAFAGVAVHAANVDAVRGIFLYTEHPENATDRAQLDQALKVPGVDGVTILVGWKQIETSKRIYSWTFLDSVLAEVIGAGKKAGLAIRAGQDTPNWLFTTANAAPLDFQVAPLEGDVAGGSCNDVKIAAPWDPAFLGEWDAMLGAVAQHLHDTGAYDKVGSIRLTGINRTTAEFRLPAEILTKPCVTNGVATWMQAGYRPSKLLAAWDAVTTSFAKSFPDKVFTLPIIPSASGSSGREYPFPAIDEGGCPYQPPWNGDPASCTDAASFPDAFPPNPDQNAPVIQLASQKFPGRLVVAYQNIDWRAPAQPYLVYAAKTWGTMIAFQTNDYVGPFQQAACSVSNGNFAPCTSSSYLALLNIGIYPATGMQAQYIEVLPPDALAFPDAIRKAHNELVPSARRHAVARH